MGWAREEGLILSDLSVKASPIHNHLSYENYQQSRLILEQ